MDENPPEILVKINIQCQDHK